MARTRTEPGSAAPRPRINTAQPQAAPPSELDTDTDNILALYCRSIKKFITRDPDEALGMFHEVYHEHINAAGTRSEFKQYLVQNARDLYDALIALVEGKFQACSKPAQTHYRALQKAPWKREQLDIWCIFSCYGELPGYRFAGGLRDLSDGEKDFGRAMALLNEAQAQRFNGTEYRRLDESRTQARNRMKGWVISDIRGAIEAWVAGREGRSLEMLGNRRRDVFREEKKEDGRTTRWQKVRANAKEQTGGGSVDDEDVMPEDQGNDVSSGAAAKTGTSEGQHEDSDDNEDRSRSPNDHDEDQPNTGNDGPNGNAEPNGNARPTCNNQPNGDDEPNCNDETNCNNEQNGDDEPNCNDETNCSNEQNGDAGPNCSKGRLSPGAGGVGAPRIGSRSPETGRGGRESRLSDTSDSRPSSNDFSDINDPFQNNDESVLGFKFPSPPRTPLRQDQEDSGETDNATPGFPFGNDAPSSSTSPPPFLPIPFSKPRRTPAKSPTSRMSESRRVKRPRTTITALHDTTGLSLQPWLDLFSPVPASSQLPLQNFLDEGRVEAAIKTVDRILAVLPATDAAGEHDDRALAVITADKVEVYVRSPNETSTRDVSLFLALHTQLASSTPPPPQPMPRFLPLADYMTADTGTHIAITAVQVLFADRMQAVEDLDVWRQCLHMSAVQAATPPRDIFDIYVPALSSYPDHAIEGPVRSAPRAIFSRESIFAAMDSWTQHLSRLKRTKRQSEIIRERLRNLVEADPSSDEEPGARDGVEHELAGLRRLKETYENLLPTLGSGEAYQTLLQSIRDVDTKMSTLAQNMIDPAVAAVRKRRESMMRALANNICQYQDQMAEVVRKIAAYRRAWADLAEEIAAYLKDHVQE